MSKKEEKDYFHLTVQKLSKYSPIYVCLWYEFYKKWISNCTGSYSVGFYAVTFATKHLKKKRNNIMSGTSFMIRILKQKTNIQYIRYDTNSPTINRSPIRLELQHFRSYKNTWEFLLFRLDSKIMPFLEVNFGLIQ